MDGKTYLLLAEMWIEEDGSFYDDSIYMTIVFDGDISDQIPRRGSRILLFGTMETKTVTIDGSAREYRCVNGKSFSFYYEYQFQNILIAIITLNVISILIILTLNHLKILYINQVRMCLLMLLQKLQVTLTV